MSVTHILVCAWAGNTMLLITGLLHAGASPATTPTASNFRRCRVSLVKYDFCISFLCVIFVFLFMGLLLLNIY